MRRVELISKPRQRTGKRTNIQRVYNNHGFNDVYSTNS